MSNNTIPAAVIEANQFNEVEMPMEDVQARVDAWLAVISDVEQRGKLDRKDIGDFSVNGFEFVVATNSIMLVNRMIAVCTPANARMLTAYFKHFLPWKYDDEKKAFTTRLNAESKKFARKLEDWHAFRLDPSADVWTWFSAEKQKSKLRKIINEYAVNNRDSVSAQMETQAKIRSRSIWTT